MKTKLSFLLILILFNFSSLFAQFTPQTPDLRLCGTPPNYYIDYFSCNSNNWTLEDVFLSVTNVNGVPLTNTTCTPGTPQQVYVQLNYSSNANSAIHNVRLFADILVDGQLTTINKYIGTINPGAGQSSLYGPFTWICGQEISLTNALVVWTTNNPNIQNQYNCNSYNKSTTGTFQ
mgnify:FL=1